MVFQASQVTDLEEERNKLKEQLAEMSQKIESLEGTYNRIYISWYYPYFELIIYINTT